MTVMTRRKLMGATLAAGSAAAFGAVPLRARAAEFAYKMGHPFPLTHPVHIHAVKAAELIKKDTDGRVEIEVFGNSQLGLDTQEISQVRTGAIQFFTTGGLILSTLVPAAAINGMGFAFKDYPTVWKALDGDLGAYIRGGFDKVDLHAFEKVWDNGFREVSTSTKPINGPDDLKGLKIRVPVSPLYTSLFQMLGAAPTSINLGEAYSALQTKIVDAQENPLVVFDTAKFYEVQKYISFTNHVWDGSWILANGAAWRALPKNLQDIVAKNINEQGVEQRADSADLNNTLQAELVKKGIVINTPDQQPFREALRKAGFYKSWAEKYGPEAWGILEKSVGQLT